MTKLFLAAGVAALAIAAPATAEKGGKGGGDKGQAAKAERGGGGGGNAQSRGGGGGQKAQFRGNGGGGGQAKAERRGRQRVEFSNRGNGRSEARAERRSNRVEMRSRGEERRMARAENRGRQEARGQKAERKAFREQRSVERLDRRDVRVANREVRDIRDFGDRRFALTDDGWRNSGIGCPPGLASKNELCMPPGQYKKRAIGQLLPAQYSDRLIPLGLRDYYQDDDDYYYRLGNGYVYRVDRDTNLVASLLPLLGAGLGLGQMFPTQYMNSYVPDYYQSFYPDTQDDYYRFANGYVYEIDRSSGLIESMIPMYANGYGVGQMLPASYSYYNLPDQYRGYYSDSDDYYYRYAPGAIYQVDRGTNLITSIASLLAGDLGIGQRLPMSYSAYNVPLQYRDRYYDTADNWYRYNDGNIYQVDPTTRLITAVISALV